MLNGHIKMLILYLDRYDEVFHQREELKLIYHVNFKANLNQIIYFLRKISDNG